jgi:parallel beta-helix repeat protein
MVRGRRSMKEIRRHSKKGLESVLTKSNGALGGILDRDLGSVPHRISIRLNEYGINTRSVSTMLVVAALFISTILVLLVSRSSSESDKSVSEEPTDRDSTSLRSLTLTSHEPIIINGNAGFSGPNSSTGIARGNGTESDPYDIEGWEISGWSGFAISITNADVYFVIHDCYVHDMVPGALGFYLSHCSNGTVKDCIFANVDAGIWLSDSKNNSLVNNTCSGCFRGIWAVGDVDNCSLVNNNCSNCYDGICLGGSNNNKLVNNTCNSNFNCGIYLDSASNNTLTSNNCSSNDNDGVLLGKDIPSSSSDYGNELSLNSVCNNVGYGVNVSFGSDNRIWNNTFIGNNGATDTYDASHVQASDDGTDNWWNDTNGYGNNWSDWRGPDLSPMDGFVDYPYLVDGSAGSLDYYPIAEYYGTPIPEFGMMASVVIVLLAVIVLAGETRRKKKPLP